MTGFIESTGATIGQEAVKYTFSAAIEYLKSKYQLWGLSEETYINYCKRILTIKTLASGDKTSNVDDIYVPLRILKSGSNMPFDVQDTTTLDITNRAILIKGLAGQGKSTLLRKLLSNNSKKFTRMPVFFELKNYRGGSLEDAISKSLIENGLKLNALAVKDILSDSNVKLYLDAFDEVAPIYRDELISNLTRIINSTKCHLICTARPDTEIESLSVFDTYTVCELLERQIFQIIERTCSDKEKSDELCKALKNSAIYKKSGSALKSPILVVLFCVSYNLGEEIPDTLSQFYSNIFETVFYRHDNLKGRVNRVRLWNDNRRIYRDIFDFISFASLRCGYPAFRKQQLAEFVAAGINYVDESSSFADTILEELVSITNLIIEDGFNEYRYTHKSIQEFYAASFIKSLNNEKKLAFYIRASEDFHFYIVFENVLFFLKEIDYYDYSEYFFVPSIKRLLGADIEIIDDNFTLPMQVTTSVYCILHLTYYVKLQKFKGKQSYSVDFSNILIDPTAQGDFSVMKMLRFVAEWVYSNIDFTRVRDTVLSEEYLKKLKEGGEAKFSMMDLVTIRAITSEKIEDAINLSISVNIRRDFNLAMEKLRRREKSISSSNYLDF